MKKIALLAMALAALTLTACASGGSRVEDTQARHQGRAFERVAANLSSKPGISRCWTVVSTTGWFNKVITKSVECEGDPLITNTGDYTGNTTP